MIASAGARPLLLCLTVLLATLLTACGSPAGPRPPASPTTPPATKTAGPSPELVAWARGYCRATKDVQFLPYRFPKPYEVTSEAARPKVLSGLRTADTHLRAAISGLRGLPKVPPPAHQANAKSAEDLRHYVALQGRIAKELPRVPSAPLNYLEAVVTVVGIDMVAYKPTVEIDSVPGLRAAMKPIPECFVS